MVGVTIGYHQIKGQLEPGHQKPRKYSSASASNLTCDHHIPCRIRRGGRELVSVKRLFRTERYGA